MTTTEYHIGQRVTATVPGEPTGWDEDRGRPDHIEPDRSVTGRIAHIHYGYTPLLAIEADPGTYRPTPWATWILSTDVTQVHEDDAPHTADLVDLPDPAPEDDYRDDDDRLGGDR